MYTLKLLIERTRPGTLCYWRQIRCLKLKAALKEPKEIKIPVPWGHIAGKWWGSTAVQPILALHGWEDNAGSFDRLAPLLEVDGLLAIDFPGHGYSSHFPVGIFFHFLDAVTVVRLIARHFKWNKISLLGHSFGSAASFVYAATYPSEVNSFISIDCARTLMPENPVPDVNAYSFADWIFSVEEKLLNNDPPVYSYEEIVKLLYEGSFESPTEDSCKVLLQRGMIHRVIEKQDRYYFSRDPRYRTHVWGRLPYESLKDIAQNIRCSVLSIRGKQGFIRGDQRESVYFQTVEIMKKNTSRLEHYDVDGTHHLHLNNPELVAPLINRFLNL